ncbi:regulatory protein FlaEY [Phenylobacterium zucineum HLK1]|uniref:Regulatory protein FlaEY n=1 Tax=Phenylobacterium zucineum (strain HLK1) TaxID=450851 RepID=B4R9N8_PHEZH|nr:hypothetical protein [Phenylobacterium zucineum]ACG77802.1 regulatory protein FlaEY [Phenylobacterium zucineum HLK1]
MVISIDTSLLMGLYQSRLVGTGAALSTQARASTSSKSAPTAPWSTGGTAPDPAQTVKAALQGRKFIDEGGAQLDLPGASTDYRKMFALYSGLSTLMGLAERMQGKGVTSIERSQIQRAFARGMAEVGDYVSKAKFENLRLVQGEAVDRAKTTAPVPRNKTEYITPPLVSGSSADAVPAFSGDVKFNIKIKRGGVNHDIAIDLAGMGAQTRSLANVVNFVNDQLAAAGVDTRFATHRTPGQPKTIESGGKTITLKTTNPDQWSLKVKVSVGETVSFDAPATAGAAYLVQTAGDPDPDGKITTNDGVLRQQLVKFQTDTATVPAPVQQEGEQYWVDGRAFSKTFGPEVKTVRSTQVGPDGSVYMLADVTGKIDGETLKGTQDVALLKFDAAGKLVYSRTLGASEEATGLALAVSADGKVAIAGAVKGGLNGATDGPLNSGTTGVYADQSDSFVTLFNADGEEIWTARRGARKQDEATHVAFAADGSIIVAGRAQSTMPGSTAVGDWDSYIQAFQPELETTPEDRKGKVKTLFTETFGSTGADRPAGMVVDGTSVVTASVEEGRAVLRRFDISGGTPVLTATRDLGDLQGGEIAGLALDGGQVVIAGYTANAGLAAGTVTRAHAGGTDAFAARLSADLSAGAGDRIAFYGGAGDDRATSLAVSGGQVWIAGAAGTDLPGHPDKVGDADGFLTRLDVATGAVDWSRRFTAKDGHATPTSIAIDPNGASVLDRIGLPKGTLELKDSQTIVAQTGIRPGEEFRIRSGSGRWSAVTIDEKDTIDTLAQKIRRATGFQAKVNVTTSNGLRVLSVTPSNDRSVIEFSAGKADKDALAQLGIPEGVVRATDFRDGKTVAADGKPMIYGLSLDTDLNLDNATEISHALADVAKAQGVIRQIYRDLVRGATPEDPLAKAQITGTAPKYLTDQIANYQAALARLGG